MNVNLCPSLLGQKFFVHFLEEMKKPKSPFKINWPLASHITISHLNFRGKSISAENEDKIQSDHALIQNIRETSLLSHWSRIKNSIRQLYGLQKTYLNDDENVLFIFQNRNNLSNHDPKLVKIAKRSLLWNTKNFIET